MDQTKAGEPAFSEFEIFGKDDPGMWEAVWPDLVLIEAGNDSLPTGWRPHHRWV